MNRLAVQLIVAGFVLDLGGIVYCASQMRAAGGAAHAAQFHAGACVIIGGSILLVAGQALMIRNFLKNRRRNKA